MSPYGTQSKIYQSYAVKVQALTMELRQWMKEA